MGGEVRLLFQAAIDYSAREGEGFLEVLRLWALEPAGELFAAALSAVRDALAGGERSAVKSYLAPCGYFAPPAPGEEVYPRSFVRSQPDAPGAFVHVPPMDLSCPEPLLKVFVVRCFCSCLRTVDGLPCR